MLASNISLFFLNNSTFLKKFQWYNCVLGFQGFHLFFSQVLEPNFLERERGGDSGFIGGQKWFSRVDSGSACKVRKSSIFSLRQPKILSSKLYRDIFIGGRYKVLLSQADALRAPPAEIYLPRLLSQADALGAPLAKIYLPRRHLMSSTWEDISTQVDGHLAPVPILQADLWLQKTYPQRKKKGPRLQKSFSQQCVS